MKNASLLAVAAISALALSACQKKEAAQEPAAPEAATAPAAATAESPASATAPAMSAQDTTPIEPLVVTAPAAPGPPSTATLLWGVTLTNLYQLQAGKIAETKAQSPAVKELAKSMVTDHVGMTNQMKHLFKVTNEKIPTELGPRGRGMIDALNAAAPADFDKLYLDQQRAAQQAELSLLKDYAEGGESADIKPAAAKAVPMVQAHLDKVHELQAAAK